MRVTPCFLLPVPYMEGRGHDITQLVLIAIRDKWLRNIK